MKIRNTAKQDPLLHLMSAMMHGSSGSIERQEAEGQSELAASTQLPRKGLDDKRFAEMGITFDPEDAEDPLFVTAVLPIGWKKVPTDHSMWTDLVDGDGKKRGRIFYKAAFYDRDAFISPTE